MPLFAEFDDLGDKFLRKYDAGWVIGTVDDDRFGIRANGSVDVLHGGGGRPGFRGDDDRGPLHHLEYFRGTKPIGGQNYKLVFGGY